MKILSVAVTALTTAVASVSAVNFTILEPWGGTIWTAGETGTVVWSASTDILQSLCEIHLLTGNVTEATFVINFAANGNFIPCNYTIANLHPLPDYASGQYFIRIGPTGAAIEEYGYSGLFNFAGNGTVPPNGEASSTAVSVATSDAATEASALWISDK